MYRLRRRVVSDRKEGEEREVSEGRECLERMEE